MDPRKRPRPEETCILQIPGRERLCAEGHRPRDPRPQGLGRADRDGDGLRLHDGAPRRRGRRRHGPRRRLARHGRAGPHDHASPSRSTRFATTAAPSRAALARAHVVGDMPFMSYQVSPLQAVESAGKLMKEGAFESVKLEGGEEVAEHVHRIVRAGIPVVGHVGLTPQSVHALGGFKVQGRGDEAAEQGPRRRARARAGRRLRIVLEAIPPDVAERVTARGRRSRRSASAPGAAATGRCSSAPICSACRAAISRSSPSASPSSATPRSPRSAST